MVGKKKYERLVNEFDYDAYITKRNDYLLDLAYKRFVFSVIDSDYYIAHPFDKLSNIASKEYDLTLEIGEK